MWIISVVLLTIQIFYYEKLHRRISMLDPLFPSILGLTELLELRRRRRRSSDGSNGFRPDCLANKLSMSVSDTTPVRRPEICAPGRAAAETDGNDGAREGDAGPEPGA